MNKSITNKKKTILFSINTEFVLCIAMLYYEFYKRQNSSPVWYILKGNDNRFGNVKLDKLPGKVFVFKNELNSTTTKPEVGFIKHLNNFKIDEFVHQNSYSIANLLLEQKIKSINPNLLVTYISDSIALNVKPRTRTLLVTNMYLNFRRFFHSYYRLPLSITPPHKYINKVNSYVASNKLNTSNAKFLSFEKVFSNAKDSKLIKDVFTYSFTDDYDIYFFTQPILLHSSFSENTKSEYKKLLKFISQQAEKNKVSVLLKIHPGEDSKNYAEYVNSYCNIFYNSNIPAELLFNTISKKKIMSCFSSISTLDFSGRNQHFWLYPIIGHIPRINFENTNIVSLKDYNGLKKLFNEIYTREDK